MYYKVPSQSINIDPYLYRRLWNFGLYLDVLCLSLLGYLLYSSVSPSSTSFTVSTTIAPSVSTFRVFTSPSASIFGSVSSSLSLNSSIYTTGISSTWVGTHIVPVVILVLLVAATLLWYFFSWSSTMSGPGIISFISVYTPGIFASTSWCVIYFYIFLFFSLLYLSCAYDNDTPIFSLSEVFLKCLFLRYLKYKYLIVL